MERNYTAEEMERATVSVKNYYGSSVTDATRAISKLGLSYEVVGNGNVVTAQMPASGTSLTKSDGKVILYTEGISSSSKQSTVPNVIGYTAEAAVKALRASGLNVLISGSTNYNIGNGAKVVSQSLEAGIQVKYGSVVTIRCLYDDPDDIDNALG